MLHMPHLLIPPDFTDSKTCLTSARSPAHQDTAQKPRPRRADRKPCARSRGCKRGFASRGAACAATGISSLPPQADAAGCGDGWARAACLPTGPAETGGPCEVGVGWRGGPLVLPVRVSCSWKGETGDGGKTALACPTEGRARALPGRHAAAARGVPTAAATPRPGGAGPRRQPHGCTRVCRGGGGKAATVQSRTVHAATTRPPGPAARPALAAGTAPPCPCRLRRDTDRGARAGSPGASSAHVQRHQDGDAVRCG